MRSHRESRFMSRGHTTPMHDHQDDLRDSNRESAHHNHPTTTACATGGAHKSTRQTGRPCTTQRDRCDQPNQTNNLNEESHQRQGTKKCAEGGNEEARASAQPQTSERESEEKRRRATEALREDERHQSASAAPLLRLTHTHTALRNTLSTAEPQQQEEECHWSVRVAGRGQRAMQVRRAISSIGRAHASHA